MRAHRVLGKGTGTGRRFPYGNGNGNGNDPDHGTAGRSGTRTAAGTHVPTAGERETPAGRGRAARMPPAPARPTLGPCPAATSV
ncbi:hypothetical protein SCMC78_54460 [Streptomyces sp. CMC78]|uniref:Uncharacterized protein n=1 Tax=Streptomyces sp. CMC78 TaxID=3231512 RepID=A0AB33KJE7_9ACTN